MSVAGTPSGLPKLMEDPKMRNVVRGMISSYLHLQLIAPSNTYKLPVLCQAFQPSCRFVQKSNLKPCATQDYEQQKLNVRW